MGAVFRKAAFGALIAVAVMAAPRPASALPKHPVGLSLELGAPFDLAGLRLAFRPLYWMRLNLGGVTDVFSGGISGGVTFVPINFVVSPSATVEAGYLFPGDPRVVTRMFGFDTDTGRYSYTYVNGHLGLEIGANKRVCFYIHGGYSYFHAFAQNVSKTTFDLSGDGKSTVTYKSANAQVWGPSVKLGLTVFF